MNIITNTCEKTSLTGYFVFTCNMMPFEHVINIGNSCLSLLSFIIS